MWGIGGHSEGLAREAGPWAQSLGGWGGEGPHWGLGRLGRGEALWGPRLRCCCPHPAALGSAMRVVSGRLSWHVSTCWPSAHVAFGGGEAHLCSARSVGPHVFTGPADS